MSLFKNGFQGRGPMERIGVKGWQDCWNGATRHKQQPVIYYFPIKTPYLIPPFGGKKVLFVGDFLQLPPDEKFV